MNKWKVSIIYLILALLVVPLVSSCARESATPVPEEPIIVRCATYSSPMDLICQLLQELETIIPEETNGRVKFEVYPGGTLYSMMDGPAAMVAGDLEMSVGGGAASFFIPEWDLITAFPFLFEDDDHYFRAVETDEYKQFVDRWEAKGIKHITLCYPSGTSVELNSVRPIDNIQQDFRGLKLTGPPSGLRVELMDLLGAEYIMVDPAELTTALETRMVDGSAFNLGDLPVYDFPRLAPYMYVWGAFIQWPQGVVVSTKWWDTLPSDLQQILTRVLQDQVEEFYVQTKATEPDNVEQFKADSRTVVTYISDEDKAWLKEQVAPIREQLCKENPDMLVIFEASDATR